MKGNSIPVFINHRSSVIDSEGAGMIRNRRDNHAHARSIEALSVHSMGVKLQ
jgi:hypothetical protein